MTAWEPGDEVDAGLSALRVHDALPERTERIRERCLARLAARRRPPRAGDEGAIRWRAWLEPAVALGLCVLYLAEAVTRALAVYH
ncbi:MAG TPA: hypothetical protein VMT70_08555 [Vicinamibacteria bacterium]|nr:hypothetical protein [Vicinamibacteria bacterium]